MEIIDKKQLVIGLGKSGLAAAKLLKRNGGSPFVSEMNNNELMHMRAKELESLDIGFELGFHDLKKWSQYDLIVISPGINPVKIPILSELDIPVISEVELAFHFLKGKIIGITGSNGKSTTTALAGEIFRQAGKNVYVVGNIGNPISDIADITEAEDYTVIELSSFQLEKIFDFHADLAVLLNLTPDHLDRHETLADYFSAKMNLFHKTTHAILNADDLEISKQDFPSTKSWFSMDVLPEELEGVFIENNHIVSRFMGKMESIVNIDEIAIPGPHNLANSMACTCIAKILGTDGIAIKKALKTFKGLSHRLELVETIDCVRYVNDSKSTNPDSLQVAMLSYREPVVLIAGGYNKNSNFDDLVIPANIEYAVLIGQTKEIIGKTLDGQIKYEYSDSMEDALEKARINAKSGGVILLSPACASYDMFDNFEQRGDVFKTLVKEMKRKYEKR